MRNPLMVSARVYLRPLETSDAAEFARHAALETETFMTRGRWLESPLAGERWIERLHERQPPEEIELAVCLREDDRVIGIVGVEDIDWVHRTGETGSWLTVPDYRGRGYGTEAKHLLLEYLFERLGLHVLRSTVWEPNGRSAAALAKQGYRPAGRLKWHDVKAGVYRDLLVFDVTRAEWLVARDEWRSRQQVLAAPPPPA